MLTVEEVQAVVPKKVRNSVTQDLVDKLNNITQDPLIAEQVRNNFISYTGVLNEGKFTMDSYLSAVMFVSHKLMNKTDREAYIATFPDRYTALVAKGTSNDDIAAYVHAYRKGKLVNLIMEQTMIPTWVLNQDLYQKALNHQAYLMLNAKSEFVQQKAAESILNQLQKPKEVGPLINLDLRDTAGMAELKEMLSGLAMQQRQAIQQGVPTKAIAEQTIIQGELADDDD